MDDLIMEVVGHYMDEVDGSGCEQVQLYDD